MKYNQKRIISMLLAFLLVLTSCFAINGTGTKAKAAEKDVSLHFTKGNEWRAGNATFTQVNGQIINNTNQEISGWKVDLPVQSNAVIDQSWCGTYTISKGVLTIVTDGNNSVIWGKSNITFGFIVKNGGTLDLDKATLFYDGMEAEPTVTPSPTVSVVTPTSQPEPDEWLDGIWVDEKGFVCSYQSDTFFSYIYNLKDPFDGSIQKIDENTIKVKDTIAYRANSEMGKKYSTAIQEQIFDNIWAYEMNYAMHKFKFTATKVLQMEILDSKYGVTYSRKEGADEDEDSQDIEFSGCCLVAYGQDVSYSDYLRLDGNTLQLFDSRDGKESRLTKSSLSTITPTVIVSPTNTPTPTPKPTNTPAPGGKDWLYTDGSRIYDANGTQVWLTGVNWFGYNTGTNIFDGVWSCDLDKTIKEIANRGFNLLRIPISSELLLDWKSGRYPKPCYNDYVNQNLAGMNSLQIFDHVVAECKKNGIKIMMDIHCATNAVAHYYPVWFTPDLSEEDYLTSLKWMTERYKDDDTIIAVDLKNEPHGKANDAIRAIWNDSKDKYNWKYAATKAANAVLSVNPNLLIVVEGIEVYPMDLKNNSDFHSTNGKEYYGTWWGGNLRGVKDYPIDLGQYQNKLVYSPHDYGPAVFQQSWFEGNYTMQSLYNDCWHDNWFYIQEENIAPLLIGEWGGYMTEPNLTWMTYLRDFIIKNKINHTFWCFNANSGDTGGLVLHDFTTWDEEKYEFLKPALWQKNGKFVGLDHDIPLGENGLSLSAY